MGSPEIAPNGDDMPQIIRRLIDETLISGAATGEALPLTEHRAQSDPLSESRQQAQNTWKGIAELLARGETLDHDSATTVGLLLYTLIGDAIERNDPQQVQGYLTALDGLTIRRDIKMASYVRAMRAGHKGAETSLCSILLSEWSNAPLETGGSPDPVTTSPLLRTAVQVCQQSGGSADTFISDYALSPAHALQLRLVQLRESFNPADRLAVEERATEDFVNLSTINTLAIAKQAIETITDPVLRLRIMEHTLTVIEDSRQAHSPEIQSLVESTFSELLWTDLSGEDPVLGHMANLIQNNHASSPAPFVDAWEIDQRIFSGNTPEQIVKFIDDRTSPALTNAFDFVADLALANRDTLLQKYAAAYAAHGDLRGAKLCLAGIGDSGVYEAGLHACISHSSTAEELEALLPDTIIGESDGSDIPSFTLAMADYNGDAEGLCTIAMNLAREVATDPAAHRRHGQRIAPPTAQLSSFLTGSKRDFYLYSAFKRVEEQNPLRSYQLATDILALLRTHDNPQSEGVIQFLSDALVRDGDPGELRRAYDALPRDKQGNRPLRGIIRLLNLRSNSPLPDWLRAELDFACG